MSRLSHVVSHYKKITLSHYWNYALSREKESIESNMGAKQISTSQTSWMKSTSQYNHMRPIFASVNKMF